MSESTVAPTLDKVASESPSLVRYGVLALLCALAFVLYIDRVCIGQAATFIQADLSISNTQWGFVMGAFTLAYTLFEVPTGHWGDRHGSRRVLLRIVLWWSAFTALTGCVWATTWSTPAWGLIPAMQASFLLLMLIRFLFGVGEAGAFPNIARVLGQWFPAHARGSAQGAITTSSLVGGAAAPIAASLLIAAIGWRSSFVVFGSLGVIWAVAFYFWFRDRPEEHPGVNAAERALILAGRPPLEHNAHPPIPWRRILPAANLWLMGAVMNCGAAVFYMLYSWYATYLKTARDVSERNSGWMTSMVMAAGACGCLCGGFLSDWMVRRTGERRRSRRIIGCGSFLVAGLSILAAVRMETALASSLCIALAFFCVQLQIPSWWGVATEISGPHVGAMFGLMNSMGAIGAIGSPIFLGYLSDYLKSAGAVGRMQWDPGFYAYAGLMLLAAVCWLAINPNRSLVEDEAPGETAG
jgi:ACS family glucarate transporter-like MFS transporter